MAGYLIQGETLTGIADAIRAKKDTTAIFTPEQMAVEIESIVTGDDLPNAEDAYFGTVEDVVECGILSCETMTGPTNTGGTHGNKFTAKEICAVSGVRHLLPSDLAEDTELTFVLWDCETGTELAMVTETVTSDVQEWRNFMFSNSVNLTAGKQYVVSLSGVRFPYYCTGYSKCTFDSRISSMSWVGNTSAHTYPSKPWTNGWTDMVLVDIIFGEIVTETPVSEYKVQKDTMDDIAEEVQRITGTTEKMTTAQIITALQGVAVQSSE